MKYQMKVGGIYNVPTADYYAESDEELESFENVVPGSTGAVNMLSNFALLSLITSLTKNNRPLCSRSGRAGYNRQV